MENNNILLDATQYSSLTFGKIILYGAEIIFIIQFLMVVLNYSRNWRDEQNNLNSEISFNSDINETSSSEKDSDSIELSNSDNSLNEKVDSSTFTVKKILSFISVLPLSSFYLLLKLSYNIIKVFVYNLFDSVLYFVNYWILNFPERFEEYIISFFNNYIFRSINYITENFIMPCFSYTLNTIKSTLNEVFSEENYDRAVYIIEKSAENAYDKFIIPFHESLSKYSVIAFNNIWNFTKEVSVKVYDLSKLLANTLAIFTLDFFEDVQVAWSGIQWFGINIAQPAASFMEDVLLTLTIRPLAYSVAFFKILVEKTVKLLYKCVISLALILPSLLSIAFVYIYQKFNLAKLKHAMHVWLSRWVYLPIWYVVYFLVNYGEKLVVDYIPRAYHSFLRLMIYVFSKLVIIFNIIMEYLKLGLISSYQILYNIYKFTVEYIPYAHKKAMKLSKDTYKWMKLNIFPWIDTIKYIVYDIPLNISKNIYQFIKMNIYSEDSIIGKNSRVVIKYSKHLGEIIFENLVQAGQYIKTFTINILRIVSPHVIDASQKIISILNSLSIKFYNTIKPVCKKEIEFMVQFSEKEFKQLSILINDFLKELKVKINEKAALIYQAIINENKKLHQSYASKKEFNKEFLHKNE
ncbi:hypothetical protein U3516DRAFT_644484 [Neocallimastix sp. 'constans']|jgi:hypothetical protein